MLALERDRIALAIVAAIAALAPSAIDARLASAQCPEHVDGCHEEDVAFHWREGFLDSIMLDTGWVPSGSPVQIRFALYVGGETEIDLAGTSFTWWPSPLSVAVPGTPGSGLVTIDYGIELLARVRFDVEVAGVRYNWEGDIPIGSIPHDLRVAAMTAFDSMLLPPQAPRPVTIEDATERFEVVNADLAGLIGIPGVSGGLVVEAQGSLAASYRTDRIEIGDAPAPITEEGAATVAGPDPGATDFGASKDVVIAPVGQLDYDGTIDLHPILYLEVAGRRFDVTIASVPVPIVDLEREVRFDPVTVHVPLPDVIIEPRSIDFGEVPVWGAAAELLEIRNEGEAPLVVTARMPRSPFSIDLSPVEVPPGASRMVEVQYEPERAERTEAMLFFDTTDPDESLVVVRLSGRAVGSADADGGVVDAGSRGPGGASDGGCGCRAGATSSPPWLLAAAVGLALAIRRRRAR